jgi:hypothetical protein
MAGFFFHKRISVDLRLEEHASLLSRLARGFLSCQL